MNSWIWRVDRLRKLTGTTQQQVADGSGLSRPTIWRLEREDREHSPERRERSGGIDKLVKLYRYFWSLGTLRLEEGSAPRRVSLCDIIEISPPLAKSCARKRFAHNPTLIEAQGLPGVYWNLYALRNELSAKARPAVSPQVLANALGCHAKTVRSIESGQSLGTISLLVQATRYFSENLRPIGIDELLIVNPEIRSN